MRYLALVILLSSGCSSVRHLSDASETWIVSADTDERIYYCVANHDKPSGVAKPQCFRAQTK